MRRRELVGLLGAMVTAWPLRSRAEQRSGMRKLGVLMSVSEEDPEGEARIAAFRQGLQELGWREGENIHIDYRWSGGHAELISQYAKELVALAPDLIVASGTPVVAQIKPLTRTIPIVCALVIDPVGLGFVESLSRPGGNITGFSFINPELIGKWTALLKNAAPKVTRAALVYNPKVNPWYPHFLQELAAVPQATAFELVPTIIDTVDDLQTQIPVLARTPGTGLILGPEAFLVNHLHRLAKAVTASRMPSISVYRQFAVEGGLMSYGPDSADIFRRSASYVDRILKGANPATLPMQQPVKFGFTVNQNAAATLGLTLPAMLLAGADEVLE